MDIEKGARVKPFKKCPRKDWDVSFRQMQRLQEDNLLISDCVELDLNGWEWWSDSRHCGLSNAPRRYD